MGVNILNGRPARYNATLPTLTDGAASALQVDNRGRLIIAATVLTGSEIEITNDSGNSIPVGGQYTAALPTLTDGDKAVFGLDQRGNQRVTLYFPNTNTASAGLVDNADGVAVSSTGNKFAVQSRNTYYNGTSWDRMRGDTSGMNVAPYPAGATALAASSGNVANSSAAATLAGAVGATTYISGFVCTAGGATAGSVVTVTVTGTTGGTMSYTFAAPTGAAVGASPLVVQFPRAVPASATNTAIVVTMPALGAGNTNATVSATGFRM